MTINSQALREIFNETIRHKLITRCLSCLGKLTRPNVETFVFRCTKSSCRKLYNALEGTPFTNSKLPLNKTLQILRLWCSQVKTKEIAELLDLERKSVGKFLKICSLKLQITFKNNFEKIGGKDIIVEIDESKFGKNKYHRGHKVKGVWIFGMVERTPQRRIVLLPIEARDKLTLTEALKMYVDERSTIYSDQWKGYVSLNTYFEKHMTVNHSENYKDPLTGVHSNTIEGNWCAIKSQTPVTARTKEKVQFYLIRSMLKRNYNGPLFNNLLKFLLI